MINWVFWAVPEKFVKRYAIGLILIIYVFPWFFGFYYTKIGAVIKIIWYNVIFYWFAKMREKMEDKE